MAIGEFQPDLRPAWKIVVKDGMDYAVPVLEKDGSQKMNAYPTFHSLPWPSDSSVSSISEKSWFSITKGWNDEVNPVSGTVYFIGWDKKKNGPAYLKTEPFKLIADVRKWWEVPQGTTKISVLLHPHFKPVGWCLEIKGIDK